MVPFRVERNGKIEIEPIEIKEKKNLSLHRQGVELPGDPK